MNKELIEKLKDKTYVRAFGLMTPEERECLMKIGRANCEYYTNTYNWTTTNTYNWTTIGNRDFSQSVTYAIKPDYQPESEFVDLEIKIIDNGRHLGVNTQGKLHFNYGVVCLYELSSLPNFFDFWYKTEKGDKWCFTNNGLVATYRAKGKTVYARFRK